MGILLQLLMTGLFVCGLNGPAYAEGEEWTEGHEAPSLTGAVYMGDLPPPTAGALDAVPEPPVGPAPTEPPHEPAREQAADSVAEVPLDPAWMESESEPLVETIEVRSADATGEEHPHVVRQARETFGEYAEKEEPQTLDTGAEARPVELYITSWCGYCRQAREFLRARGIPFVEYDIERDAKAARRKQDLNGGPGVPVALINGQVVVGFSHSVYENALQTVR